jgi:Leucine Rich repeat
VAVQSININNKMQTLEIQGVFMQHIAAEYIVNFLQEHPGAVSDLSFACCYMNQAAVEIFRAYFASRNMALRHICFNSVNLHNENGRRLLSGLHGNTSVKKLELYSVGMVGSTGGEIITEFLQNNNSLEKLNCHRLSLGIQGARSLQPGLGANQTLKHLCLDGCRLGDEGVAAIVEGLEGNTTMTSLNLAFNDITSNGLPHVTKLLQQNESSLDVIDLDLNPGLFDDQENTSLFATALQNTTVKDLRLSFCELPSHSASTLFAAVALNKNILHLRAHDHVQLGGQDLERVLELIAIKSNLVHVSINLDVTD